MGKGIKFRLIFVRFRNKKNYPTAILERRKAPNRLIVAEGEDNSIVTMHPAKMEALNLLGGVIVLIKVSFRLHILLYFVLIKVDFLLHIFL